jgi:hypothetical protein
MPMNTCEMRWFLDGELPRETERWFADVPGPAAAPPWREDRYLILPGVADMGIKQRESKLEIKGRIAVLGIHAVAAEIEGVAERWCKWSYDAASSIGERFRGWLRGPEAILVGKGRAQRHFLLEPGGPAQPTAKRDLTQRGFSLELTRIRLAAGDHWSLGIEAAPDDAAMLADLLSVLRDALQGFPLPLPPERSMAYPAWLLKSGEPRQHTG